MANKYTNKLLGLFTLVGLCLASASFAATSNEKDLLKVGFILVGSHMDYGWNYAHDQGRLYIQSHMADKVQTSLMENVPENAEAERAMEKMIAQGNKLIFATSYGYLEPAQKVAVRHPDVIILHAGRSNSKPLKNLGTYFANQHEPNFAAGIVAGRMTKHNYIGYVGAHPVPPLLLSLNSFVLGARSVNPKVTVHIVWTNSWHDPVLEAEAAKSLIDQGADVLLSHQDSSVAVVSVAEKNKVYCIGSHVDLRNLAPKTWLTGSAWEWGPLYQNFVRQVLDGTWKPDNKLFSSKDKCIKLASFGNAVPTATQKEASSIFEQIKSGKKAIFKGPLKDRDGKLRIPAGIEADNAYLENINWLVEGIEGSLAK